MAPQNTSDKEIGAPHKEDIHKDTQETGTVTRRKFTRNILLGSAVLLTLSNKTAWGGLQERCISTQLWDSFTNGGRSFESFNPAQQEEISNYEQFVDYYHDQHPPTDVDGTTCYSYQDNKVE